MTDADLDLWRDCPRCGGRPSRIYWKPRSAYCRTCQRPYGPARLTAGADREVAAGVLRLHIGRVRAWWARDGGPCPVCNR